MPNYSVIIRKGKFQLDLTTTDSEFVINQFELWIKSAKDYAQKHKVNQCKNNVNTQIKEEEKITQKNIDKQISNFEKAPEPELPEPKPEPMPLPEKLKEEPLIETNNEVKNDDLDIFYAPPAQKAFNQTISDINKENDAKPVFDNILEDSMNNPQTELKIKKNPSIQRDDRFIDYMCSKQINKKTDYLLLVAYYFAEYEGHPRFTIKQLNAKLMQNMAVIVDHSVIQEAVNRNFIECLPDLTGVVGASEYRLTSYGEKVLLDA